MGRIHPLLLDFKMEKRAMSQGIQVASRLEAKNLLLTASKKTEISLPQSHETVCCYSLSALIIKANTLISASGHRAEKPVGPTQASDLQNCEIMNGCLLSHCVCDNFLQQLKKMDINFGTRS